MQNADLRQKSTNPLDYQHVPRPVAAMAKQFADGYMIDTHSHDRDQFLYAVSGVMRVRANNRAWIVPPDRAVYMPAGLAHSVAMRGNVDMRTLYIEPEAIDGLPKSGTVLDVSDLLRSLVVAIVNEPILYDTSGRAGDIARLLLSEISRAKELQFVVPMPGMTLIGHSGVQGGDRRLERLCSAFLENPSSRETLEDWAATVGASPRTLARLFQNEIGMSFGLWRQRVRFHNAIEALIRGEPIARIAASNGYRSASAFTAAFRKTVGDPPSAFRHSDG